MREGPVALLCALSFLAGCAAPKQEIALPSLVPLAVGDKPVFAVAWSPDGSRIAVGTDEGRVMLFDAKTGTLLNTLPPMLGRLTDLAFDPSGRRLLGVTLDGGWCEWSVAKVGAPLRRGSNGSPLWGVRLSVRDEPTAAPPRVWVAHEVPVGVLAVDSNGVTLEGRRLWSPPRGDIVTAGAVSRDYIAVGTREGRLVVLDHSGMVLAAVRNGIHRINTVAFSPDSRLVVDGGVDGVLHVSSLPDLTLVSELPFETGWITDCAFSPDGARMVVAGHDLTHRPGVNRTRVWRVPSR